MVTESYNQLLFNFSVFTESLARDDCCRVQDGRSGRTGSRGKAQSPRNI